MAGNRARGTVVFDIIGTCFSLKNVESALAGTGAGPPALELWFSQTLRDVAQIVSTFGELDPQPGFIDLVTGLADDGWKIVALTNSSADATRKLLERADVADHFAALLSCDSIQKTKPHPDVYDMARREAEGEIWMVAAHAWDIAGAARAGFRTAFIAKLETAYLRRVPEA